MQRGRHRFPLLPLVGGLCTSTLGCDPPETDLTEYTIDAYVVESPERTTLCLGGLLDSVPPQCIGPEVVDLDWSSVPWAEHDAGSTWALLHLRGTFSVEPYELTLTAAPEEGNLSRHPDYPLTELTQACPEPDVIDPTHRLDELHATGLKTNSDPDVVALWVSNPFTINLIARPGRGAALEQRLREGGFEGPLCVVEKDLPSYGEQLAARLDLLEEAAKGTPFGPVFQSILDERTGEIHLWVTVVDAEARAWASKHGGDRVQLHGHLTPVAE